MICSSIRISGNGRFGKISEIRKKTGDPSFFCYLCFGFPIPLKCPPCGLDHLLSDLAPYDFPSGFEDCEGPCLSILLLGLPNHFLCCL